MSLAKPTQTKFWIICREETELTQKLASTISSWNLPGVRARVGHQLSLSVGDAIAQADFAIFITLCETPGAHLSIAPVSTGQSKTGQSKAAQSKAAQSKTGQSPASLLNTLRRRHGHAPQSWWLQLPTVELRARGIRPIPAEQTLSQALTQIEVFIRNHYLKPLAMQAAFSSPPTVRQQPSEHPVHIAA